MTTVFYRDARLFALALLMIIAAGASALTTIGRQEDPTITNLFATVITPFPGADPARVEALVTEKIEDELKTIPEIDDIRSVSRLGVSVIQIELSQFISHAAIEQAWSEIRDKLSDAAHNFPQGVPEPEFDNDRTGAFTTILALKAREGVEAGPAVMRRVARLLQDRLRGVAGTKRVELYGAAQEEVTVAIRPKVVASLGLTAGDVSRAIRQADAKVRAGQVRGAKTDLVVEVAGEIDALERIRAIPLKEGRDGRIVRVGDVATVTRGERVPAESVALVDGRESVLVAAQMQDDLQVDQWAARVRSAVAEFEAALPGGLELETLFDQSGYTAERLSDVLQNMGLGMALVVAVLFVTLGWRAAMVVAIIIPLSGIGSIAILQWVGVPIHQMSVTGLIVALGLLVDAAIVMTDEIRRRLAAGGARLAAVDGAVRRLVLPLVASTATTVLAFMPMMLLPGPAGDFVGSIATAVIVMLVVSLVLALTITPALAGWLLRAPTTRGAEQSKKGKRGVGEAMIAVALARPRLAMLGALVLPAIGFGAFPTLKPQFFPGVDRNQFYIQVKLADGTAIRETERVARRIDEITRGFADVTSISWVIGESAPAFYYNMIANQDGVASFAEALVTTTSPAATEAILDDLQRRLNREAPEARAIVRGLVQGPPVDAPVELRIVGPELDTLRRLGDRVRLVMREVPGITIARADVGAGAPKVSVALSEEKVRLAGLDLGEVARQLEGMLEGVTGGSIVEGSEELPIRVRVGAVDRGTVGAVAAIDLVAPAGGGGQGLEAAYPGIPVRALGDVTVVPAETAIHRRNGERINTVQGFVERDLLPEVALGMVQARLVEAGFEMPPGYRLEVGGDSDARDETLRNLLASLGLIVTLTIASLVIAFGSWRLTLVSAVVALLSIGLSLLALALFRYPFGIQAVIGVIGSIGVSINAAIVIMTALQADGRALRGDAAAIAERVAAQGRHIVSTTVTTFGGFLPLILAGGGFWPPFAMAIGGGVLLSTVVSFFFVPPAFLLLARAGRLPAAREDAVAGAATA